MARNAELERTLADRLDDVDGYRVYADWLLDQGDTRGELIGRSLEYERTRDAKLGLMINGFIQRHVDELVGELAPLLGYIRWRFGFFEEVKLDRALIREPFAPVLERVLAHPSAALLRSLVFHAPDAAGLRPSFEVVARAQPAALRSLKLGVDRGLGAIDELFPLQLERFELYVPEQYTALDPITPAMLPSLARAPWRLRALALHTGTSPARLDDLVAVITDPQLALVELRIAASHRDRAFASTLVRELAGSATAQHLEKLELDLDIGPADHQWLVAQKAERMPKLSKLDIPRGQFRRRPR